jgi:hypothetical protein
MADPGKKLATALDDEDEFSGWLPLEEAEPVFYRTIDPIRNIRLRVRVRRLYGREDLPVASAPTADEEESGAPARMASSGSHHDDDARSRHSHASGRSDDQSYFAEATFAWQAKVFGPRETVSYVHSARRRREAQQSSQGNKLRSALPGLGNEYTALFDKRLMRKAEEASALQEAEETDGGELLAAVGPLHLWTFTNADTAAARRDAAHDLAVNGGGGRLSVPGGGGSGKALSTAPSAWIQGVDGQPLHDVVYTEAAATSSGWLAAADATSIRAMKVGGSDPRGKLAGPSSALLREGLLKARGGQVMRIVASVDVDTEAVSGREAAASERGTSFDRVICEVRAYTADNLVEVVPSFSAPDPEAALRVQQRREATADAASSLAVLRHTVPSGTAHSTRDTPSAAEGPKESLFAGRRTWRFRTPAGHTYEVFVCNADDEPDSTELDPRSEEEEQAAFSLLDQLEAAEALAAADASNRAMIIPRPPPGLDRAGQYGVAGPGLSAPQRVLLRLELCAGAVVSGEADSLALHFAVCDGGGWRLLGRQGAKSSEDKVRAGMTGMTAWCWPMTQHWAPGSNLLQLLRERQATAAARASGPALGTQVATLSGLGGLGALGAMGSLSVASDCGGTVGGLHQDATFALKPVLEEDDEIGHVESCGCGGSRRSALPVAHWNHHVELELVRDEAIGATDVATPAHCSLTCLGRDGWGRVSVLGYGRVELPTEPGSASGTARLWRPRLSPYAAVADFFLGGAGRLVDLDERDDGLLPAVTTNGSRFGLETEEASQVHWRCDVVAHRAAYRGEPGSWVNPPDVSETDVKERAEARRAFEVSATEDPDASTVAMGHRASTQELIEASRSLRRRTAALSGSLRPASSGVPPPRPVLGQSASIGKGGVATFDRSRTDLGRSRNLSPVPSAVAPVDDVAAE